MNMKHNLETLHPDLGPEDFREFLTLFGEKLQPSPINLDKHIESAGKDPILKDRLTAMIDSCFAYTKDVARHEYLRRTETLENPNDVVTADAQRAATHARNAQDIRRYFDALEEKRISPSNDAEVIPSKTAVRAHYGKFAVLLTLNRFKDQITFMNQIIERSHDVNYEQLRQLTQNEAELFTIEYVEILSAIIDDKISTDQEARLHEIEDKLQQDENHILQAFANIYDRTYTRRD